MNLAGRYAGRLDVILRDNCKMRWDVERRADNKISWQSWEVYESMERSVIIMSSRRS